MSYPKSYAATYTMRSAFYQHLGMAGKELALAYVQADRENQAAIKELAFDALLHALAEFHGYSAEDMA